MSQLFLRGSQVYLRALEPSDVSRLLRWFNDPEITQYVLRGRLPINELRENEWLANQYKSESEVVFGVGRLEDEQLIGAVGIHDVQWVDRFGTVGIVIGDQNNWGFGYGTEAMSLMLRYGFDTLNLNRIELSVFDFNERAMKSYLKLGFVEEGRLRQRRFKHGRWVDEVQMAVLREAWTRS